VAIALAVLSSTFFGIALVTGRLGLRALDARSGAAISIPTATVLFAVASPFALDTSAFSVDAAILFAVVGLFFPAIVTLLTFRSNEQLGPTVTGAVSGTAPLFALLAASLLIDEQIPAQAGAAAAGVAAGIVLLSWNPTAMRPRFLGWSLLWPIAGAVVRGVAQVGAKAGLLLWPNPFAAGLIGYTVSSAMIIGVDRFRRGERRRATKQGWFWFGVTGALNGGAVLLMYAALSMAAVSMVAPIVAAYPLITALASAIVLRAEPLTARALTGAVVTVAAILYLVVSTTGA
jgi:drug/metabolite transporter (DMT)-like permease